ncbi:receptor-like protein EIX2 [Prosopis cineraria]|uniref:receptor-like protein EIX2 n=1 Tax=Prosopis cineraria TaxID=364024 RepID=UPI0024105B3F|nr:receptor-like protein EIX2 [Prosopis cineraria]
MRSLPDNVFIVDDEFHLFTKGRELDYYQDDYYLKLIDFSNNNLSGEIPKELFYLTEMWSLNLSRNHLVGKIPKEIGGMKSLESLDLSNNRLSGEIPWTISNLSFIAYLNLSYNNFNGQIPLGTQIQTFDVWSFVGNLELCGDPLPKKCNVKEETFNSNPAEGNEDDNFLKSLYLGMGVGFAVGFWGVCGSLFLIRAWRHKFFQWFYDLVDQLCVVVVLCFKSSC